MSASLAKSILKYVLGVGLLTYVIVRNWEPSGGGPGLADAFRRPLQPVPVALASLFLAASALITFVRWYVLVRAQMLPITLGGAVRLGLVGNFFNSFLPSSVGGDVVKAVAVARTQRRRTAAITTILLDRAIGLWALVWLVALLGGGFWLADDTPFRANAGLRAIVRSAWVVVGVTAGGWLLLGVLPQKRVDQFADHLRRIPKVGNQAAEFWLAIWLYRTRPAAVVVALLLSVVSQTGNVLAFHFAAQVSVTATESDVLPTLAEHVLVVPLAMAIESLFPAPGGMGSGEYAYGQLYSMLGRPEALGVLASLARRSLTWAIGLVGYLVYLRLTPSRSAAAPYRDPAPTPADEPVAGMVGVPDDD
jgi:uncharacterized membrane protein YbhN (UPF0104 family)